MVLLCVFPSLSLYSFVCLFACLFLFLQQMKLVQGEEGEKNRACCLSLLPQVFSPNLLGRALSHDYRSFLWGCRRERSSLPASPALIDKGQQREQWGVNISPNATTVCNGETGAQGKEIVQFCQPVWVLSFGCVTLGPQKRLLIIKPKELWALLQTYLGSHNGSCPVLIGTLRQ